MSGIAGVLFDKDGVLVDFHRTWGPANARVIRHFAASEAEALAMAQAIDFDMESERFSPRSVFIAGTAEDTQDAWQPFFGADPDWPHKVSERMTAEGATCVAAPPEVPVALNALQEMGLPLGIATNDLERSARLQMETLGLTDLFATIMGADSGHGAKPGPGMILAYAAHLNVEPSRIVMVGDSTHDLYAARAAGAIRVAIGTGPADLADLAPHADHTIETMEDLPELVAGLHGAGDWRA